MSEVLYEAYYDYRVCLMDTDTEFREVPKVDANGNAWNANPANFVIDDPDCDKRWELEGVVIGESLNEADLVALVKRCFYENSCPVTVSVEDNGRNGDGLHLLFHPLTREGNYATRPSKWGDRRSENNPAVLFGIRLTKQQAAVLGAALTGAANLRKAQEK